MNDITIGAIRNSYGPAPINWDDELQEAFYGDDQDLSYCIFGIELQTPKDTTIDLDTIFDDLPTNCRGIIYDGQYAWLLMDDYKAYRVARNATSIEGFLQVVDYDDDTEYEGIEDE